MGEEVGHEAGPSKNWWTAEEESPLRDGVMDLDDSPSKSMLQGTNKGHQRKVSSLDIQSSNSESNTEEEIFKYWATEDVRKQNMKILHSATDSTLVEEAMRYGSVSLWKDGTEENENGCWDLVETNGGSAKDRGAEWSSGLNNPHAVRGEKEDRWEESDLAKFSLFLGFSTEGLEEEILDFFIKIRKRRERIHGKVLLEKSKFERELKRLECSVNYEKGRKQRDPSQGKGCQITVDLGDFGVEEGQFSLSCRFRNVENGTVWVFTRVYGPFTKEERECLWEEIGAIRGLWEDPWCVGGDYNITLFQRERSRQGIITSAMRRFAQIVDEVGLMDIPLQGGVFTWSGVLTISLGLDWIEGGGLRRGPSPFRFENMWLKVEGFQDLIRSWW
ncbi:hypothetical protein CK203_097229 [Vitis vinifera]|uniref:Uncharacterized protein n=1 Tax=Vitis vinifera TaxID=29760 RepID=A0A438DJ03_VITVI|nr:hypothetical protein CK203_097229 [Vitis vinifera]